MPALTFNLLEEIIMEFIKWMEEQEVQQVLPLTEQSFRMFFGGKVGNLRLSIQASYAHYCNPRKTIVDLNEYTKMEFAIIDEDGDFISVTNALPGFSRLSEIEECFEGQVYPYVPVDLINDFYNELKGAM